MTLSLVATASSGTGPLEVHSKNPRWLTTDSGKTALVLTGSHTWDLFQDYDFSPIFEPIEYLDDLEDRGENFTRGWFWEDAYYSPLPYVVEEDGLFRLSPPYDPDYLKRLRSRIRAARRRGLFVSVMLFQGWSMDDRGGLRDPGPWPLNPYNRDNTGERVTKQQAALHIGVAQRQQLEYVSYLANGLCSEPNIVWEIVNEAHPESFGNSSASNWQRNILEHLRSECDRHLAWVSCPSQIGQSVRERQGLIDTMLDMSAEIIAPCDPGGVYLSDPPVADGSKVVISDSDHLDPQKVTFEWAWKAFLRGQHPIFMDLTQPLPWWHGSSWDPDESRWSEIQRALGAIQDVVSRVNKSRGASPVSGLAEMAPQSAAGGRPGDRLRPASSKWALFSSDKACPKRKNRPACGKARANGDEFLVYAEPEESVRVCRLQPEEPYRFRWKKAARSGWAAGAEIDLADSNGCIDLENPTEMTAVLHLERASSG